jgi:hypothetical protein
MFSMTDVYPKVKVDYDMKAHKCSVQILMFVGNENSLDSLKYFF